MSDIYEEPLEDLRDALVNGEAVEAAQEPRHDSPEPDTAGSGQARQRRA